MDHKLDGYNQELMLAFEYNGIQHYIYNPYFHASEEEQFESSKYETRKKKDYARKNL